MKKNKSIKNFFGRYEGYLYGAVAALIYGVVDWWYGLTSIWYITGSLGIVLGLVGVILFDCLRVKTDEFDRYVKERLDKVRGAGLFEPEDTFRAYAVIGAENRKVASDGKVRTEICHETTLKVDRKLLRIESYGVHVLTEETECFAADFPMPGVTAKQESESFNDGKRVWRQDYLTLTAADGRSFRFPVPVNSADVDQFIDRLTRYNRA
ncbi:MAG: hypothetical protein J6D21_01490 [Clostridia bacterium]|nr:hypothetical protein [Clostridia bacterium]MBO5109366.1 hypothetical protein [Clostridia bacterium]